MRYSIFTFSLCLIFSVFCVGQDSLKTVVAEPGDGILSLLRKQGVDPYDVFDEFVKLNNDNLRDSVHLIAGKTYVMPHVKLDTVAIVDSLQQQSTEIKELESVSYDIFGEKHKNVIKKSDRLEGNVYYLVSGHGGPDPGAMGVYAGKTIAEDEYAYDITLRLAKELMAHGAKVYIIIQDPDDGIRDDFILEIDHDEEAYLDKRIPLNQVARLKQRVEIVNDLYKSNK